MNKFFSFFKNASVDELIELSHEDNEWKEKTKNFRKSDQIMDSMNPARVAEYKEQYEDIVEAMEQLNPHTSYSSEYIDISRLDVIGYRNEDGNYILPKEMMKIGIRYIARNKIKEAVKDLSYQIRTSQFFYTLCTYMKLSIKKDSLCCLLKFAIPFLQVCFAYRI